jgi:flagellar basal body-associated protein FliL
MLGNEDTKFTLTASQRRLKAIVIGLGVLIVLALGALITGFVIKLSRGGPHEMPAAHATDVAIEPGTTVESSQLSDGKLTITLKTPNGEEVVIVDAATGRELSRVRLKPKP